MHINFVYPQCLCKLGHTGYLLVHHMSLCFMQIRMLIIIFCYEILLSHLWFNFILLKSKIMCELLHCLMPCILPHNDTQKREPPKVWRIIILFIQFLQVLVTEPTPCGDNSCSVDCKPTVVKLNLDALNDEKNKNVVQTKKISK
jgi:hypothetical protein